eukprot:CAMPEP_0195119334 /NCGR_PEP_ID=MMETSP0448-20130528/119192_1 /TAXON_ID=66468 /ORGANISM="Heterocapsa triquestra, Strain CCMP 448" /LENGTH=328 /DNA_ID=CAMNT_0040156657 /DNA_START=18 /DNA_END=1000 /DNA_ORIENTATION=+
MGQSRDASLAEAKKNKGKNFTQDTVCKHYLLGFCPQYELAGSKLVSKRNLGECNKVHSDAMKEEYENSPDKEKFRVEYEKSLMPFLEAQIREADAWVSRERANAQKAGTGEKKTINTMPESVKDQVTQLTADMNKMMAAAEELAEKGEIDSSKFKVVLADEIKNKVKELEEAHPTYTVTLKEEWVCDICGTRTDAVTENNETRFRAHFTGKVHLGYQKIRDWVKELRKKQRDAEEGKEGKDDRDRKRRRSRSRGEEKDGKEKEKEKEKGDRRDRSRDRRETDKDGGDDRDRRRREEKRDGDRRGKRDRSGDRDRDQDRRGRRGDRSRT